MSSDAQEKLSTGEGFVKICRVKKARLGDGGELERTLVDVTGTGKTVPYVSKSDLRKNFAKDA